MANQSSTDLVRYETAFGEVELSVESIRSYLCPKATVQEAYIFLQKCRFQRLNPFLGEVYLVIYEATQTSPRGAQMIIGKEAHTRRAERHPDYQGMEAGVVVLRGGEVKEVAGAFLAPGDQLLGGWCKVHRKGREVPDFISVTLKEYDNGRRQWKAMPATMIRKVAVVQALREAFPNEMAGLQGSDEFALAEDQATVIEGHLAPPSNLHVSIPAGATGIFEEGKSPGPAASREERDPERDIDDLFPKEPRDIQEAPPAADAPWDPDTEPPPPLPEHVSARTHLDAVLHDQGWDVARLQADVLKVPLATYLQTPNHNIDGAYQLFKRHLANAAV